jgi:hypothetical protein
MLVSRDGARARPRFEGCALRSQNDQPGCGTTGSTLAALNLTSHSNARQDQFRPQPADRGVAEDEAAARGGGDDHDDSPSPDPGLICPLAAPGDCARRRTTGAVVIDDDAEPSPPL